MRQHAGQQRGDVLRDRLVDGVDVVGQAAHQLAGRVAVEEAERQGLQVREEVLAQLLQRALRDAGHDPAGNGLEQVVQQIGDQHQQGDPRQARRPALVAMNRSIATPIRYGPSSPSRV